MKTKIVYVNPLNPEIEKLMVAANILKNGELVAFPTETVYGLGGDALNVDSVKKIFKVKGRPIDNPLIVHINSIEEINKVAINIPELAYRLMDIFFPGPLTLILPRNPTIPPEVSAYLPSVAVRMPAHPIAINLIKLLNSPIAAPSANKSSRVSPVTANHVYDDFKNEIKLIIDGGITPLGLESTVLDLTKERPTILRPGVIPLEELKEIIPSVEEFGIGTEQTMDKPASPGMKYKHYSPVIPLILVTGKTPYIWEEIIKLRTALEESKEKIGLLLTKEGYQYLGNPPNSLILGSKDKPLDIGSRLYLTLRELEKNYNMIIVEGIKEVGIGRAVMNRLKKAASKIIEF